MFGEPLFREAILRQSRDAMSSMMYQKADKLLIAEDIPKNTTTNKSKLLKGNYSYWNVDTALGAISLPPRMKPKASVPPVKQASQRPNNSFALYTTPSI